MVAPSIEEEQIIKKNNKKIRERERKRDKKKLVESKIMALKGERERKRHKQKNNPRSLATFCMQDIS